MPILLNEHEPPQLSGYLPGTTYQLSNILVAPAAEIQDLRPR